MTQDEKPLINSIDYVMSQIEDVCNVNNKEDIKMINNLKILLEKNMKSFDNPKKYLLEEKIDELRNKTHNLCFLRRNLLQKYSENYKIKNDAIFDKIKKNDANILKETSIQSSKNIKESNNNENMLIKWEKLEELDCKNILLQIPQINEKINKINLLLTDNNSEDKKENLNKGYYTSDNTNGLTYTLSYFKNL